MVECLNRHCKSLEIIHIRRKKIEWQKIQEYVFKDILLLNNTFSQIVYVSS